MHKKTSLASGTLAAAARAFGCLAFLGIAVGLTPTQATASSACPVSAGQASQILGYAVEPKNLGTLGCNYVCKRGLTTVMIYHAPSPGDAQRRVDQVRSRLASPGRAGAALARVAVAVGSKGASFVQLTVQPRDPRVASAFLNAVLAKL